MAVKSVGLLMTAGALFIALAAGLIWLVTLLIRANQNSVLASSNLASSQEVRLDQIGEVVVLLEVPRISSEFRNFQLYFTNRDTGHEIALRYHYLTAQKSVYGVTTMKVPFGRLINTAPATWSVNITGFEPGKDYSNYQLILSKPYIGRMAVQIVGIVFCGLGMLLCVIWSCWLLGLMKPVDNRNTPVTSTPNQSSNTIDLETWKRQQKAK
jgi:hypothetical protein